MFPLALGICLELYLVGVVITDKDWLPATVSALAFGAFAALWAWLPRRERRSEDGDA
jgi:hypothetical protein